MKRFHLAVGIYLIACLAVVIVIILHGDGPHPRIIALYPHSGDRYFPGGLLEITFSQPMNQYSVERGLEVTPGSEGQGAWFGNTLNLKPLGDWRTDTTYHIRLVGKVTDDEGRPLETPVAFWFRVHRVTKVGLCRSRGIETVCDETRGARRPLLHPHSSVASAALSPDNDFLAYIRRDASGLPHLFILSIDTGRSVQVTHGNRYADSQPHWLPGYNTAVSYQRRLVVVHGTSRTLGHPQEWEVQTDGTGNSKL